MTETPFSEVLLHVAVYAGVPAANTAFSTARKVLDELAHARENTSDKASEEDA